MEWEHNVSAVTCLLPDEMGAQCSCGIVFVTRWNGNTMFLRFVFVTRWNGNTMFLRYCVCYQMKWEHNVPAVSCVLPDEMGTQCFCGIVFVTRSNGNTMFLRHRVFYQMKWEHNVPAVSCLLPDEMGTQCFCCIRCDEIKLFLGFRWNQNFFSLFYCNCMDGMRKRMERTVQQRQPVYIKFAQPKKWQMRTVANGNSKEIFWNVETLCWLRKCLLILMWQNEPKTSHSISRQLIY